MGRALAAPRWMARRWCAGALTKEVRSHHAASSSFLLQQLAGVRRQQRPAALLLFWNNASRDSVRWLSSSKSGGGDGGDKDKDDINLPLVDPPEEDEETKEPFDKEYHAKPPIVPNPLAPEDEDPFGLNFDDGSDGLRAILPPSYKRDKTTGAFTGEIVSELTDADKELLAADSKEKDRRLLDSVEKHWQKEGVDESGLPAELDRLGQRVRESDMALNVMGRSVRAQASAEELDDGSELGRDERTKFSQHLTKQEFRSFAEYMRKKHGIQVAEDDLPVQENKSSRTKKMDATAEEDPDHRELSLKWLTARAQRQLDESIDDNPYSDLMPGDLSPSRLVNRKNAKQIPRELLHHNNVELLHHFISPTGLIRHRAQTRLGARDQRKVAKLIKRARNMGLVPYAGQFKAENHGWKHAPDIHEEREWERQMVQRGLVVQPRKQTQQREESGHNESGDSATQ